VVSTVAERRDSRVRSSANGISDLVQAGVRQFVALSGEAPERVSGVRSSEEGWSVLVDVVELERVPSTTSVMCTYRLDLDADAQLTGFERVRRFTRASTDGR
jgi:Gas vesicle synthesis protein GvpO